MKPLKPIFSQIKALSQLQLIVVYLFKFKQISLKCFLFFVTLQYADVSFSCAPSNLTTIQIQYQKGTRLPIVSGKINGKDAMFLMDTGASWTFLMPDAVKKYSLFSAPANSKASGVAGESSTSITRVNSFEFGNEKFDRPYFFVLEKLDFSPYFDVILGADYLYRSSLEIDIRNLRLRKFDFGNCSINDLFEEKKDFFSVVMEAVTDDDPRPKFKLQIGKHIFVALIDTAATSSTMSFQVAKKIGLPISFDSNENIRTISGVGGKVPAIPIAITSVEIGNYSIKQQGFMVTKGASSNLSNETEILFGLDFLKNHIVIFDMKKQRIFFSK
jgi:predicted aspartyl protease